VEDSVGPQDLKVVSVLGVRPVFAAAKGEP